jgi:hypothetical protein
MSLINQFLRYTLSVALSLLFFTSNTDAQVKNENFEEYLPKLDGVLKTKIEFDLDNSLTRFEVRNARFGVRGKVNQYFSYRAQLDLSDEGVIKMLDAYVRFTPVKNLDFYMGQRKIPFSTDYMRDPAENFFANRSFIAKYINDGLRDIGFYANYKTTGEIPLDIFVGAVNGTGNNNPEWIKKPNLVGRIAAGSEEGLRVTGNSYFGEAVNRNNLAMLGGEIRYIRKSFLIETEYVSVNYDDTLSFKQHRDGLYIHSYYIFNLNNRIITMIYPTARWDFMGKSILKGKKEAERITVGINTGFDPKLFHAEIRLNYENYISSSLPIHTDKITLEFVAKF